MTGKETRSNEIAKITGNRKITEEVLEIIQGYLYEDARQILKYIFKDNDIKLDTEENTIEEVYTSIIYR